MGTFLQKLWESFNCVFFIIAFKISEVPEGSRAELDWFEWSEKIVELRAGEDISLPFSIRVSGGINLWYRLFPEKIVSETSDVYGFDTGYLLVS